MIQEWARKGSFILKGVILWSLTTIRPLPAQEAAYELWKLPAHFEIHNAEEKARQPQLCGAQRHARREGDELGAARPAQRSRVGKRGRPRKELAEASCQEKGAKSRACPQTGPQEGARQKGRPRGTRLPGFSWPLESRRPVYPIRGRKPPPIPGG